MGNREETMEKATIQDWTDSVVLLKFDQHKDVKYQVYREEQKHFLELRDTEDTHIHTLELPDGMKLDRTSYEVLLRYVLLDVVAA
jgi:alpha-D-ribose 1-methylphosphonate 5-phosphate C-P lyase